MMPWVAFLGWIPASSGFGDRLLCQGCGLTKASRNEHGTVPGTSHMMLFKSLQFWETGIPLTWETRKTVNGGVSAGRDLNRSVQGNSQGREEFAGNPLPQAHSSRPFLPSWLPTSTEDVGWWGYYITAYICFGLNINPKLPTYFVGMFF